MVLRWHKQMRTCINHRLLVHYNNSRYNTNYNNWTYNTDTDM